MRLPAFLISLTTAASITSSRALAASSSNSSSAFIISNQGPLQLQKNESSTTIRKMSTAIDTEYPGTAVERMLAVRERVAQLANSDDLSDAPWEDVRRKLLWAGGLRDLSNAVPGQGYTGHAFNDFNHVDLTCMLDQVSNNENDGQVKGIAIGNQLGPGIRVASIPELGPGGSWSTCAMGCNYDPPRDVAHLQFRSRIAFKLVWVPNERYDRFVLVDDDGNLLAQGKPNGVLPPLRERQLNYRLVAGSKYSKEADRIANNDVATE